MRTVDVNAAEQANIRLSAASHCHALLGPAVRKESLSDMPAATVTCSRAPQVRSPPPSSAKPCSPLGSGLPTILILVCPPARHVHRPVNCARDASVQRPCAFSSSSSRSRSRSRSRSSRTSGKTRSLAPLPMRRQSAGGGGGLAGTGRHERAGASCA